MWLIIALLLKISIGQHIIQVGEKEFVGEDAVLTQMVNSRTAISKDAKILLPKKEFYDNLRLFGIQADHLGPNETRRFDKEPPHKEQKKRAIELMQHNIYMTQYRMQHLKNITEKYSQDIRFRVAIIFCRLDTLIKEMRIIYTYMNQTVADIYTFWSWLVGSWEGRKRPVHMHLLYYTQILKRNIDVTYLVEHMIGIHEKYMRENFKIQETTVSRGTMGIGPMNHGWPIAGEDGPDLRPVRPEGPEDSLPGAGRPEGDSGARPPEGYPAGGNLPHGGPPEGLPYSK